MKKSLRGWRVLLELALLAGLVIGLGSLLRLAMVRSPEEDSPSTQESSSPGDDFAGEKATPGEAYPPPGPTEPSGVLASTASVYPPPAPTYIFPTEPPSIPSTTVNGYPEPEIDSFPTFTPYPTSTERPGPSLTPIPPMPTARDAAGQILYLTGLEGQPKTLYALAVDPDGNPTGSIHRIAGNLHVPDGSVYRSPDAGKLLFQGDWGVTDILDISTLSLLSVNDISDIEDFYGWHADNLHLLIRRNDGGLWMIDLVEKQHTPLAVSFYGRVQGAAASPDGKRVIYTIDYGFSAPAEVWMINADGRDAHLLFKEILATNLAWSPDGKQIAFLGDGRLTVMDAAGTNLRILGKGIDYPFPQCYFLPPAWSPDSRKLAVVTDEGNQAFCDGWSEKVFAGTNIYLVDVESGAARLLVPDGSPGNLDPAWSPDGSQVAFVSQRSGSSEVWAIHVDGSHLRQLTHGGEYVRFPFWNRP